MLLYLLHFDQPVSGKLHYSGSCEDAELQTRLRRHQLGTGSKLTARAHAQGVGFSLGMVMPIPDRNAEAKWKAKKRWTKDCTCCHQVAGVLDLFPNVLHFVPVAKCNVQALSSGRGFAVGFD